MATRKINIDVNARGAQKAASELGKVDKSISNVAKSALKFGTAYFSARSIVEGAKMAVSLAKVSGEADKVRRSFESLAKEPNKMLESMRDATSGMISDMELMQKYNSAALLGLPLDRFDDMLKVARGASQATGESMEFMLNSIVTGLGRGSKLMLDNLGIMIDTEKAYEKYAVTLGKTASELTDVEKKQAFVNEALNIGINNIEKSGGITDNYTDSMARLDASMSNLSVTIGRMLVPSVSEFAEVLDDSAVALDNYLIMNKSIVNDVSAGWDRLSDNVKASLIKQQIAMLETAVEMADNTIWGKALDLMGAYGVEVRFTENQVALYKKEIKALNEQLKDLNVSQDDTAENTNNTAQEMMTARAAAQEYAEILATMSELHYANADALFQNMPVMQRAIELVDQLDESVYELGNSSKSSSSDIQIFADALGIAEWQLRETYSVIGLIANELGRAVIEGDSLTKTLENVGKQLATKALSKLLGAGLGAAIGFVVGGPAGAAAGAKLGLSAAPTGADFVTNGPQMLLVGDNSTGKERVQVTPIGTPNIYGPQGHGEIILNRQQPATLFDMANGGGGGGVTIQVQGNLVASEAEADRFAEIIAKRSKQGFNRIATA